MPKTPLAAKQKALKRTKVLSLGILLLIWLLGNKRPRKNLCPFPFSPGEIQMERPALGRKSQDARLSLILIKYGRQEGAKQGPGSQSSPCAPKRQGFTCCGYSTLSPLPVNCLLPFKSHHSPHLLSPLSKMTYIPNVASLFLGFLCLCEFPVHTY